MNFENLIIYIYGWGGGEHSKGLIALKENIVNADVKYLEYDQRNPEGNYELIDKLYQDVKSYQNVLIVGNSLGGYWANYMVEKYPSLPCILINPSLFPMETLGKYAVNQEYLKAYNPSTFTNKNKWLFLSKFDEVVNPKIAEKLLADCNGTSWLDEPHAILDYSFLVEKTQSLL